VWNDTPQFLIHGDGLGTGSAALSTDVDDVGAVIDQSAGARQRLFRFEVRPAVGKRVRRHVEDAHDERAANAVEERTAHN